MKAICVDDEPLAVEYTLGQCARLSEIDDVHGFTDGQKALDWLSDHPVDLALLDINMPKLDGITLAARIKELLAYLVDKQGAGVSRAELVAAIWEDRLYDRKQQKQLDVYIRSLRETLQEYGISKIMEMEKGILRVKPDTFVCDAYLFYSGDSDAINAYRGEYMSAYSWASMTEGILFWNAANRS